MDWTQIVIAIATVFSTIVTGWLTVSVQLKKVRQEYTLHVQQTKLDHEEEIKRLEQEYALGKQKLEINGKKADQETIDGLLSTLRYKDEQEKEYRAQVETVNQRYQMLQESHDALKRHCDQIQETLDHAVQRIEQLEGIEKAYRRLEEYTKALETKLVEMGIDYDSLDITRVISLTDWEEAAPFSGD